MLSLALPPQFTIYHVSTYLIFLALSSVSLLVFLNSSISFILTDILNIHKNVGRAVGDLGFADELVVLIAAPAWGYLSDHVAQRILVALGFAFMAGGMCGMVGVSEESKNWWIILLVSRCLFAVGAAAATTMISALLLAFTASEVPGNVVTESESPRNSLELPSETPLETPPKKRSASGRLAGFVGLSSGFGALFALSVFLPLPKVVGRNRHDGQGLRMSYWIVAGWAIVSGMGCLIGLPKFERVRSVRIGGEESEQLLPSEESTRSALGSKKTWKFWRALKAGVEESEIGLAYVGGFVARASSIGVALFLPLYVNGMFRQHGICDSSGKDEMKEKCSEAYILAAKLSGASQFVALLAAPAFGYLCGSAKYFRKISPLVASAAFGILAFSAFATFNPLYADDKTIKASPWAYLLVSGMGLSQIGAVVCSLHSLSKGISEADEKIALSDNSESILQIKGTISGVYALAGGAAILLLTKVGGILADKAHLGAPFWLLVGFNGVLLAAGVASASRKILLDRRGEGH